MSKSFIFSSREELDTALAEEVSAALREGIEARGSASLVVSGGSTPKGLFAALSATALPWEKVTVLLADERWVPESHGDSNSAMVKRLLYKAKRHRLNGSHSMLDPTTRPRRSPTCARPSKRWILLMWLF